MKRVLIRIGALGTVVILGLFAIAQAQRETDDQTAETTGGTSANPARADQTNSRAVLTPIDNPLRGLPGANSGVAPPEHILPDPPSTNVRLTGTAQLVAPAKDRPAGRAVLDPFGIRARADATRPDVPAATLPAAAEDERLDAMAESPTYPVATGAAQPFPVRPLILAQPSDGRPITDANPLPRGGLAEASEPGLLNANPFPAAGNVLPRNGASRSVASSPNDHPVPTTRRSLAAAASTGEGTGQPGGRQLEGPQSPQLTIQKFAEAEIQVGSPATFRTTVRNSGSIDADDVEICDQIPKGTRLIETSPRAARGPRGELVWTLGTLKPGGETSVEMKVMPMAEGEIGSVATVRFNAAASVKTVATKPELVVETSAPRQVLIGEELSLTITVSNPGSGVATGVVLEEHIPAGLQHAAGGDLEYEVGDLPPGESRKLELTLTASRPGPVVNVLTAHGNGNLQAEDRLNIEVVAPKLDVALAGPKRRYLEREAKYKLSVYNPGTAPAELVELVAYLPGGLKFVSANNAGHYDEANRAVYWRLEELPNDETGTVELTTMPIEAGQHTIRLRGTADKGLTAEREQNVTVEGIAAIMFEVVDVTDPIEVGGETTYQIRVLNQGTKAASNVRLAVQLPPELQAVSAEGPTRHAIDGSRVFFEGLAKLAPKADTTYQVRVQGVRPGDLRVRFQLQTDDMTTPVSKEESTRVYADE